MDSERHQLHLPVPGQRIFRSMLAIWLCFLIYLLRGRVGMPFYSAIAALQCLQPNTRAMRPVARRRVIGTFVGAFWGLIALLLETELISDGMPDYGVHVLLIGLFGGLVLYFTVLLKISDAAYFSAVVMLSITVNHIGDANPYLFVLHRVVDTLIGVVVAEFINRLHLPRSRSTDTLFLSGLNPALLGKANKLSPYAKVELNRLIEDGAKLSISTMQTPATVRELMDGVNLPYPVIAMDGAALYDMTKREFLEVVSLTDEQALRIADFLEAGGLPFFVNTLEGHSVMVRFSALKNEAIRQLYEEKRQSPYRNFVPYRREDLRHVIYFMVLAPEEAAEAASAALAAQPWSTEIRLAHDGMKERNGYTCLKICSAEASRERMIAKLEERLGTKQTVVFSSVPGAGDVVIPDADKDRMVHELKRRFEPVDLRGWRNIFRW